jgi:hypothetical protein
MGISTTATASAELSAAASATSSATPPAAASTAAFTANSGTKEFKLGVLVVHGIGEQEQADTLLAFGEPLCDWIDSWLQEDPRKETIGEGNFARASLKPPQLSEDAPAHAQLRLQSTSAAGQSDQKWLLTESWWSSQVITPGIREFLAWLVTRGPWVVLLHLHQSAFTPDAPAYLVRLHRRFAFVGPRRPWWLVWYSCAEVFAVWFAISLILAVTWTVVSLVALIPIGRLRDSVYSALRKIAGIIGDSYVYVHEPIQRAAIIEATEKALLWLDARCEKIAVIAHSQGAAVAHRALRQSGTPRVQRLITFGEGIGKLQALMIAEAGPAGALVCAGLAAPLLCIGMVWSVRLWQLDVFGITHVAAPVAVLAVGAFCLVRTWISVRRTLAQMHAHGQQWTMRNAQPELRWYDFYGTRDPVPNGPLSCSIFLPEVRGRAVRVLHSVWADHTAYWRSKADFMPSVIRQLDTIAGTALFASARRWRQVIVARRVDARRVRVLVFTRWAGILAPLLPAFFESSRLASLVAALRADLQKSPLSMVAGTLDNIGGALAWVTTVLFAASPQDATATANAIMAIALMIVVLLVWQRVYLAMWTWWRDLALEPLFTPSAITIGNGTWDDYALRELFRVIGSVPLILSIAWVFFPSSLAEVKIYRLLAILVAALVTAFLLLVAKRSMQDSRAHAITAPRAATTGDRSIAQLSATLVVWSALAAVLAAAFGVASWSTLLWFWVALAVLAQFTVHFARQVALIRDDAAPRWVRALAGIAPLAAFVIGDAWILLQFGMTSIWDLVAAPVIGLCLAYFVVVLLRPWLAKRARPSAP